MRITQGDEVRVYYGPPGQGTSFVEGVVHRVDVTTTQGRGFLIDISRDVLLGREQPVKPGYQHFVLYEQMKEFPEKVEVLSQAQREPEDHLEHGSEADVALQLEMAQEVEQEPEVKAELEADPKPLTEADPDAQEPVPAPEADGSQVEVRSQGGQRQGGRIISMFRRQK